MSDVLIAGSAGGIGSNIANYMIQYSKYTVASADNLGKNDLKGLAPALAAKNRHTFYLLDLLDRNFVSKMMKIEQPRFVVFNAIQAGNIDTRHLSHMLNLSLDSDKTEKVIVLLKDMYEHTGESLFIEWFLHEEGWLDRFEEAGKSLYLIKSCEVIGQRQRPGTFLTDTILALLDGKDVDVSDETKVEWMYAKDFYIRVTSLLESSAPSGTYRVFSGQQASKKDVTAYLSNIIRGTELPVSFESVYPDRGINEDKSFLPVRKMSFGPPENSLGDILEHVACWYRDNKRFWGM